MFGFTRRIQPGSATIAEGSNDTSYLARRPPVKAFSRAVGELVLNLAHLPVGDIPEVRALREILPDDAVGVLVETPLLRMVGMGEIGGGAEHLVGEAVQRELLAVVVGERVDLSLQRPCPPP